MTFAKVLVSIAFLTAGASAFAAGHATHMGKPPQESFDACKEKASGTACSFKDKKGMDVAGTCASPDATKPLACKPTK
jgi:hypothetical protein